MQSSKEKDFLIFQIRRKIINLYKNFFFILEDIDLTEAQHQKIRKRILDLGNDTIREIEEDVSKFDITL
jgi:hypothetical protein